MHEDRSEIRCNDSGIESDKEEAEEDGERVGKKKRKIIGLGLSPDWAGVECEFIRNVKRRERMNF